MELIDILAIEKWAALEEETYRKSGMHASAFNKEGIRIAGAIKNWANRLCPAIKATDKGQSFICAPAHMNMAAIAQRTRKPVAEEGDAGLLKIVIPIFVKDEFIGSFSACGLLREGEEIDTFMVHKTTDMEQDRIAELSNGIKTMTQDRVEEITAFMKQKVDEIVANFEKTRQ
jgi:ligand-binding sensor protein